MMKMRPFYLLSLLAVAILAQCSSSETAAPQDAGKWEITGTEVREGDDPYLTDVYWSLNATPTQERLRSLKPFPVGAVYYQQRGEESLEDAVKEFETLRDLGFTALKQVQLVGPNNPDDFRDVVFNKALDVGITPWYYGKGGWAPIDQALLDSLGIDLEYNDDNLPEIQAHPDMVVYQTEVMRERIARMDQRPPRVKGMGEPGRNNPWMPERLLPYFADWLKTTYGDVETLKDAWNCGWVGDCSFTTFDQAAQLLKGTGFDQYGNGTGPKSKDFRRFRDAMKFQSSLIVQNYQATMDRYHEWDPYEPVRTGGHQLLENQAMNTWDLEGQARTAAVGGSFYASIHMPHHFFLAEHDISHPLYWQARTVADMFKGGWAATWESTGGPTQWSGYHGYTVDGQTMSQFITTYLAAGLKGIGFWMWNSRGEGWEVAEYALTDIQGEPSDRAIVAGNFSKKLQELRFELWDAVDEPSVGILYSWENEAMLGRLSLGAYELDIPVYETDWDRQFRQRHTEARMGAARAFMNNHIPIEFMTERDLEDGLAQRYPIIYLPYMLTLDDKHVKILKDYVAQGGRLVADFPILMLDTYGRLNKHKEGSDFAELFGLQVADYYHSFNRALVLEGDSLDTQYGDLKLGTAEVLHSFDNGLPAVVQNKYGQGEVLLFNFEASRPNYLGGKEWLENMLAFFTLGDHRPVYEVSGDDASMVMRRSAPEADHYFVLNYGTAETLTIGSELQYGKVVNVYTDEELTKTDRGFVVEVPERMGLWIRAEKQ